MLIYIFWILIFFLSTIYYYYFNSKPKIKPSYKRAVIRRNYKIDSFNTPNENVTPTNYSHNSSTTLTDEKYLRRRTNLNDSHINYVYPNSIYGYMPAKGSIKNEKPKATKEFTVKLSPFPPHINSIKIKPNLFNHSTNMPFERDIIVSDEIEEDTSSRLIGLNRSMKRPILDLGNDSDDNINKKSKSYNFNDVESDDECDEDMNEEILNNNTKTIKRPQSTDITDTNQYNFAKKRIRNNEILSSYSSSNSGYFNYKRKYSPEESFQEFPKIKRRNHIEELELMTSNMNPVNIISAVTETDTETENTSNSNMNLDYTNETASKSTVIENNDDSVEEIDSEINTIESPNNELAGEDDNGLFYPIPKYIYSIKDHEYDKRKTKNRLNRFLAAVKEANQELDDTSSTDDKTSQQEETILKDDANNNNNLTHISPASNPLEIDKTNSFGLSSLKDTFSFGSTLKGNDPVTKVDTSVSYSISLSNIKSNNQPINESESNDQNNKFQFGITTKENNSTNESLDKATENIINDKNTATLSNKIDNSKECLKLEPIPATETNVVPSSTASSIFTGFNVGNNLSSINVSTISTPFASTSTTTITNNNNLIKETSSKTTNNGFGLTLNTTTSGSFQISNPDLTIPKFIGTSNDSSKTTTTTSTSILTSDSSKLSFAPMNKTENLTKNFSTSSTTSTFPFSFGQNNTNNNNNNNNNLQNINTTLSKGNTLFDSNQPISSNGNNNTVKPITTNIFPSSTGIQNFGSSTNNSIFNLNSTPSTAPINNNNSNLNQVNNSKPMVNFNFTTQFADNVVKNNNNNTFNNTTNNNTSKELPLFSFTNLPSTKISTQTTLTTPSLFNSPSVPASVPSLANTGFDFTAAASTLKPTGFNFTAPQSSSSLSSQSSGVLPPSINFSSTPFRFNSTLTTMNTNSNNTTNTTSNNNSIFKFGSQ